MMSIRFSLSNRLLLSLILFCSKSWGTAIEPPEHSYPPPNGQALQKLVVLNFGLTGDSGGTRFEAEHLRRIDMAGRKLREELKRQQLFRIVEDDAALALIEESGTHQNLYQCNGCERDLAKRLDADLILVPWIFRMSNLALTLHAEIRDVSTGKTIMKKALDFKGDNDIAWTRAIDYLIKTMNVQRK